MKSTTITIIRHGKTDAATPDAARRLTPEGVEQAEKRRAKLNQNYDLVISSIAVRTQQTAFTLADRGVDVGLSECYLGVIKADEESLGILFGKLRNAPLETYFEAGGEDALRRYGQNAAHAIRKAISARKPSHVLITCHAVMSMAIGIGLGGDETVLRALTLEEAEGFTIHENGSITPHKG